MISADYTSVMTPERRIESIFHEIEQLVAPARDLGIVGEDLVDQRRAVRAHAVGHAVDLAHDLFVEHEAV